MVLLPPAHKPGESRFELVPEACSDAGYTNPRAAVIAAKRAVRWLRNKRPLGFKPPRHISQKLQLFKQTDLK